MPLIRQPVPFFLLVDLGDEGAAVDETFYIGFVSVGDVDGICGVNHVDWSWSWSWSWGWGSTDEAIADCRNGPECPLLSRYRAREFLDRAIKLHVFAAALSASAVESGSAAGWLSPWRQRVRFDLIW